MINDLLGMNLHSICSVLLRTWASMLITDISVCFFLNFMAVCMDVSIFVSNFINLYLLVNFANSLSNLSFPTLHFIDLPFSSLILLITPGF